MRFPTLFPNIRERALTLSMLSGLQSHSRVRTNFTEAANLGEDNVRRRQHSMLGLVASNRKTGGETVILYQ